MTGTPSEMRLGTWQVAECPLLIEYSPTVLDEIRMAVVDAFFSLPRGGAEIGGILFGSRTDEGVRLLAFRPMECEHAMGPTFVLSDKDRLRLKGQLEGSRQDAALRGLEVVGWYHSHTRSEIFLSELDLDIYNEFFPQPWQVALVLRPSGMKPTRAGFFFRGPGGTVHSSATLHEFIVGAVPAGTVRGQANGSRRKSGAERAPDRPHSDSDAGLVEGLRLTENDDVAAIVAGEPVAEPSAAAIMQRFESAPGGRSLELEKPAGIRPSSFPAPSFLTAPEPGRSRQWLWISLLLAAAVSAAGYFTSESWMPLLFSRPANLHLQAFDLDGQLRIQWDRAALSSRAVTSGALEIVDGRSTTAVPLDKTKILAGSFQYVRRSEIVEVHLVVRTAGGARLEEFTSFIGQPPSHPPSAADLEREREASRLAAEAERARGDLKKQELRTLELQRAVDEMRQRLRREEERKRVENQLPARPPAQPGDSQANRIAPLQPEAKLPVARSSTPTAANTPSSTANGAPATGSAPGTLAPASNAAISQPPQPASPPRTESPKPASSASLSGRWVYSRASKSGSPFAPDAVTVVMTEANGQVRGTLTGRYRVPKGRKFNPHVSFAFAGVVHPTSSKFSISGQDGLVGEIEIIRLPGKQDALEVVWSSERDKLTFDDIFFRVP